jgi:hypothetical protein
MHDHPQEIDGDSDNGNRKAAIGKREMVYWGIVNRNWETGNGNSKIVKRKPDNVKPGFLFPPRNLRYMNV